MTVTNDIELEATEAEREAAEAAERADKARERAKVALQQREARRQARLQQFRAEYLKAYDPAALDAQVDAARDAFHQAVRSDPLYAAFIDYAVAASHRYLATEEARACAQALHGDPNMVPPAQLAPASPDNEIAKVLAAAIGNRNEDENEARQAALEAFMVGLDAA